MDQSRNRLLVIDDDTIVRESIVAYLEDSGYIVHHEADGHAGLVWFQVHRPDLVLTDLRMPGMDGLRVIEMVHSISPDTPVIVISGLGVVHDVVEALRLGASDYLVKPLVDMEMLVHSIKNALERLNLREQNRRYREELERANRELRESVRVLQRDQEAGRQVQSNMLPRTPVHYGDFTIAHKIVPSLYLSGDFVDYGFLSRRYIAFYLTDVSGHGASSAFVTVWLKQVVRRMFREQQAFRDTDTIEADTGRLVQLINSEVLQSHFGCHLTCFVGVIDTHTRQMLYVLGGHLPLPILISEEGANYLEGRGKPLGIFPEAHWDVYSLKLPDRFNLVAFSDGVLEILPSDDLLEKEASLLNMLRDCYSGDMDCIAKNLNLQEIDNLPDDIAILTISSEDQH